MKRRQTGWTIVGTYGCYYDSFMPTRRDAIRSHIGALGHTWKQCRAKGDRAVKSTLTWAKASNRRDDGGNAR